MTEMTTAKPTLEQVLESYHDEFSKSAVSSNMSFEVEKQFAIQALTKNEYLLDVARKNPMSLKQAIINVAATGLTLNPVENFAYLIPRVVNKKPQVCLEISYKGILKAATDSGSILWVHADTAKEKDLFELNGPGVTPTHKYNPFEERGSLKGFYVVAKTHEGDYLTTAMTIEEVELIRSQSESFKKGFGPWINFFEEMAKKTVIKRAAKLWPKTNRHQILDRVIDIDNEVNGIDFGKKVEAIENERTAIDEEYPRNPEDMKFGLNYLFVYGKFRGKRIRDCDEEEMMKYLEGFLEPKLEKGDQKYQHGEKWETIQALQDFRENKDVYYSELEGVKYV